MFIQFLLLVSKHSKFTMFCIGPLKHNEPIYYLLWPEFSMCTVRHWQKQFYRFYISFGGLPRGNISEEDSENTFDSTIECIFSDVTQFYIGEHILLLFCMLIHNEQACFWIIHCMGNCERCLTCWWRLDIWHIWHIIVIIVLNFYNLLRLVLPEERARRGRLRGKDRRKVTGIVKYTFLQDKKCGIIQSAKYTKTQYFHQCLLQSARLLEYVALLMKYKNVTVIYIVTPHRA